MSCCGGSCSCGKNKGNLAEESIRLVQVPANDAKLPAFDWTKGMDLISVEVELVELRFKNNRKAFYRNIGGLALAKDDRILVESGDGHDMGTVSLSGKAARKRFEKSGAKPSSLSKVIRRATERDLERWLNAKKREYGVMQEARKLAFSMGQEINITDVEFRGDGLRVRIYYTAAESVDLRGLVRKYTTSFGVKVEMYRNGIRKNDTPYLDSFKEALMLGGSA